MLPNILNYQNYLSSALNALKQTPTTPLSFYQGLDLSTQLSPEKQTDVWQYFFDKHLASSELYLALSNTETLRTLYKTKLDVYLEASKNGANEKVKAAGCCQLLQVYSLVLQAKKTANLLNINFELYVDLLLVGVDNKQDTRKNMLYWQRVEIDWLAQEIDRLVNLLSNDYMDVRLYSQYIANEERNQKVVATVQQKLQQFELEHKRLAIGMSCPEFSLTTLVLDSSSSNSQASEVLTKASTQGCATLLYFWSSACGPCKESLPKLSILKEKYPNLNIVGVSNDKEESELVDFIHSDDSPNELPFKVCYDGMGGEVTRSFSVTGFPSFVLLDKDNNIVIKGSHEYALLQFTLEVFV